MSPLPRPRALLLDLDGTLIDSAPDIARALAETLAAYGLPPLDEVAVRQRVGHGVARLVESGFAAVGRPLAEADLAAATAAMMDAYRARLIDRTRLIDGVEVLVAVCEAREIRLACVTNKPEAMARTILDHFGLGAAIPVVIGGDGPLPRKPAPDPLLAALARLGVAPDEAWMVGDGRPDMQAARAAGVAAVAVRSDYGEPLTPDLYDRLADDPAGVAALIEATARR